MSMRIRWLAILLFAIGAGTAAVPSAEASRLVGTMVTGKVTDLRGGDTILIGTKAYRVQPDSPAARMLDQVRVGTVVDLSLNGDAGNSATRVTAIRVHDQP